MLPAGVADRGVFDQGEKLIIYCNSSKERAFQKEKKKNLLYLCVVLIEREKLVTSVVQRNRYRVIVVF